MDINKIAPQFNIIYININFELRIIYNVLLNDSLLILFLRNLIIVNMNNKLILIRKSMIIDSKNYYNVIIIN